MKTNLVLALLILMLSVACSKITFQPVAVETLSKLDGPDVVDHVPDDPTPENPIPETPIPETPPVPKPLRKAGACADGQSVLSCLSCEVPALPPPPPVISTKAQKLAKIMTMSCPIYNKSYPASYVSPNAEQIAAHLLACTPELYPETTMTSSQTSTIGGLLDESSDGLRKKLFKGFWYQPPYSTDFENYFGLDGSEAAYAFCLNSGFLSPILLTAEYASAMSDVSMLDQWERDPAAQARWKAAQKQRQQLLSCFNKPGMAVVAPPVVQPNQASCDYRSFEGLYELGGLQEIINALDEGYTLAAENEQSCIAIDSKDGLKNYSGYIKIAGFKCQ